jgi:hypothetical protein
MGEPVPAAPVTLVCGILAADDALLPDALAALEREFGPRALASAVLPFDFTRYYEKEMGPRLLRQFVAFARAVDPGRLASIKLRTNALEKEIASRAPAGVPRPVNLDPGLVDAARLVLATTKDHAHRVYLGDGIYGEVTLLWHKGGFTHLDWTYPDYRSEAYRDFFTAVRSLHRGRASV